MGADADGHPRSLWPGPGRVLCPALPLLFFYAISPVSHAEILRKLAAKSQALAD
jgi:hypothetical protein